MNANDRIEALHAAMRAAGLPVVRDLTVAAETLRLMEAGGFTVVPIQPSGAMVLAAGNVDVSNRPARSRRLRVGDEAAAAVWCAMMRALAVGVPPLHIEPRPSTE